MTHLFLHEIAEEKLLGTSDSRCIVGWLKDHGISVYTNTSRKCYVVLTDFETAFNKHFTNNQ